MRKSTLILAALTVLPALVGCESKVTGNEGNFQFSYPADDRVADFNKPIAVGAYLDIEVRDVGYQQPVTLSAASTDDEGVLAVESFQGSELTLKGVGAGSALLSVEGTTTDGELLTDSVNMLAAVPEVLQLAHTCEDLDSAAYLTNQRVWLPFEMTMENTQPVIGYGYYPLTVDTADSGAAVTLNVSDSGQQYMAFDMGSTGGAATLTSTIDDTTLSFTVVTEAEIDGAAQPIAWVFEDIDVGDVNDFYVLPMSGEKTLCQAEANKTVTSDTPEICDVRDREVPSGATGSEAYEFGWFEVEGLAEGTCEYTVTYPDGDGGAGASASFSYTIEP